MKAFYVNLPRHKGRRNSIETQLEKMGVSAERFIGVDGSQISRERSSHLVSESSSSRRLGDGELGCAFSHFAIWELVVTMGLQVALVLEDDIIVSPKLPQVLKLAEANAEKFDVLKIDTSLVQDIELGKELFSDGSFSGFELKTFHWCTGGYIISLAGAKALTAACIPCVKPVDDEMYAIEKPTRRVQLVPAVVAQMKHVLTNTQDNLNLQDFESSIASQREASHRNFWLSLSKEQRVDRLNRNQQKEKKEGQPIPLTKEVPSHEEAMGFTAENNENQLDVLIFADAAHHFKTKQLIRSLRGLSNRIGKIVIFHSPHSGAGKLVPEDQAISNIELHSWNGGNEHRQMCCDLFSSEFVLALSSNMSIADGDDKFRELILDALNYDIVLYQAEGVNAITMEALETSPHKHECLMGHQALHAYVYNQLKGLSVTPAVMRRTLLRFPLAVLFGIGLNSVALSLMLLGSQKTLKSSHRLVRARIVPGNPEFLPERSSSEEGVRWLGRLARALDALQATLPPYLLRQAFLHCWNALQANFDLSQMHGETLQHFVALRAFQQALLLNEESKKLERQIEDITSRLATVETANDMAKSESGEMAPASVRTEKPAAAKTEQPNTSTKPIPQKPRPVPARIVVEPPPPPANGRTRQLTLIGIRNDALCGYLNYNTDTALPKLLVKVDGKGVWNDRPARSGAVWDSPDITPFAIPLEKLGIRFDRRSVIDVELANDKEGRASTTVFRPTPNTKFEDWHMGGCEKNETGRVCGWVIYKRDAEYIVNVSVYIDGEFYVTCPASLFRKDLEPSRALAKANIRSFNHGFMIELPSKLTSSNIPYRVDVEIAEAGLIVPHPLIGVRGKLTRLDREISARNPMTAQLISTVGA